MIETSRAECLSDDRLRAYLIGETDELSASEIEAHLAVCQHCESSIESLERMDDPLLSELRNARTRHRELANAIETPNVNSGDPPQPIASPLATLPWLNQTIGGYQLLEPLGRGGMGTVFLAKHVQLGKRVAIKLLPTVYSQDPEARQRFQREIRAAGKLSHEAIISATDAGEINGIQFLVMEHVHGLDLSRIAGATKSLRIADACEMARQVAMGLSYAHASGVVHRDIKPSNLMLDESGRVKILDFGLAQITLWDEGAVELTTVGQMMGTLDYMAPEQAERTTGVDYRADLYALGATLFRLLCGRAPLAATPHQSPLEKLKLLGSAQAPRLDTLRPDAPDELVALLQSMLARDPAARPPSAAHLAERLTAFTQGNDLRALLMNARDTLAKEPKSRVPPDLSSLQSPLQRLNTSVPRSRSTYWLIATGLASLMLFFGVLVYLQTNQGTFQIESEVADVHVRILKDQEPVRELTLQNGATHTKLRADQYEVTIDAPSDQVTIDQSRFTLRRGEVVIAHIRKVTDIERPTATNEPAQLARSTSTNPVYDGKTLAQWRKVLEVERNQERINEAVSAIRALVNDETRAEIATSMGRLYLETDRFIANREFLTTFKGASADGQFIETVVSGLKSNDEAWCNKAITGLSYCRAKQQLNFHELQMLTTWAKTELNNESDRQFDHPEQLKQQLGDLVLYRLLAPYGENPEIQGIKPFSDEEVFEILEAVETLVPPERLWFEKFYLFHQTRDPQFPEVLTSRILRFTKEAFADEKRDPVLRLSALSMYQNALVNRWTTGDPEWNALLHHELKRLVANAPIQYDPITLDRTKLNGIAGFMSGEGVNKRSIGSIPECLLATIAAVKDSTAFRSELTQLQDATSMRYATVVDALGPMKKIWRGLQMSPSPNSEQILRSNLKRMSPDHLYLFDSLTVEDRYGYLLHQAVSKVLSDMPQPDANAEVQEEKTPNQNAPD